MNKNRFLWSFSKIILSNLSHYSSDKCKIYVCALCGKTFHCENLSDFYISLNKQINIFPRNIKNSSKSTLSMDEDYQLWNYSNESFQISLLLPRIPSHLEIAVKRTNLMETSGSNRGWSKIKPPIKIFVKRKVDRYCRRGVLQKYWKEKQYRDSCLIFYTTRENWICHVIIHCLLCKQLIRSKRQIRYVSRKT